jgi:integrase
VSSKKAGYLWECKKFAKLRISSLSKLNTADISTLEISDWKDDRLQSVSGSTVNREMNLLSNIFSNAIIWKYIKENPCKGVERPKDNPPRDRLPTEDEHEALMISSGWDGESAPQSVQERVYVAWLFACESAMRQGEIATQVKPSQIDGNVVHILKSKNGTTRDVPLTPRAKELLNLVEDDFNLSASQIERNFRIISDRAGIVNLHYHDSRHAAITMLAQQIHVMDLARSTGHKDLKMLMRYYNESAKDIASKLT